MNHESFSIQNFPSSASSLPAFASLVGGEGLYEIASVFVICSDSPSPPTSPIHHITGQLTSITNPAAITNSYEYDGFLPLKETWAGNVSGNITRTFNNAFQLASVSVNGGTAIPYTYDNDGLLTNVDGMTLARNSSNGLLTGSTLGSVTDTYAYNSFGEVSNYTAAYPAGLSCQIGYTRDSIGRITGKTEAINGITTTWGYSYDQAGRLIQTTKNGDLWAGYGYDSNGNRTSKTTSTQTITGTYDAQDRLLAYGNYTYTYTANGELASKTNTDTSETTAYTYDVLGNLRTVLLPDGTQIDYIVDGRNRRVGKKVDGVLQRQWIYDGQLRPVAELDGTGALVSQFVYATHINIPDYIVKGATTYRVITDHLGSLRFVIDTATGAIAQRMDYDDWGNAITNTNADFTPFGFAGGMYDNQTKLVRFGARDYDAETGRWTAKDPIGFMSGQINLYEYSFNDSINIYDPRGLAGCIADCVRTLRTARKGWTTQRFGFSLAGGAAGVAVGFYVGMSISASPVTVWGSPVFIGGCAVGGAALGYFGIYEGWYGFEELAARGAAAQRFRECMSQCNCGQVSTDLIRNVFNNEWPGGWLVSFLEWLSE